MKNICTNCLIFFCFSLVLNFFPFCGYASQVPVLKEELKSITEEIRIAEEESSKYESGLIKSLILMRIELVKTTKALIIQRIHSLDSGAPVNIQIDVTKPDAEKSKLLAAEIALKEKELIEAKKEASKYSGGLILAMKLSAIATGEQTLAMLQQEYLRAKYGLAIPILKDSTKNEVDRKESSPKNISNIKREANYAKTIITPSITNKRYSKEGYEDYLRFDVGWHATNLKKTARSIKGILFFNDLFGETKFGVNVTIEEPLKPNETQQLNGIGFEYNQFRDSHKWVRGTELKNMTFKFEVKNILYQDGEREDFN